MRSVSAFIRKVAKFSPALCYFNMSGLLTLFERQNYNCRLAILKVLANVIIGFLNQKDDEDDAADE